MKKTILIVLLLLQSSFVCFADKTVQIIFPNDQEEKTITVRYSLLDLPNILYEPYIHNYQTTNNQIDISVPDSILFFGINIESASDYQWSRHVYVYIPHGDTLGILLDTERKPSFLGKHAKVHQYIYSFRADTGIERADATINCFLADTSTNSFFTFIQNTINENINQINRLELDKERYEFIKNLMIDEYLRRAGMLLARKDITETVYSKANIIQFHQDVSLLYANYPIRFNSGYSNHEKAKLRHLKLISGVPLDLGYDYKFFPEIVFLNKEEQAAVIAENVITNAFAGMYSEKKVIELRKLYKQIFPDSPYIIFFENLKGSKEERIQTFASYSIQTGWEEYGNFPDLSKILQTYISKPVLINFWATWCGPCISEFRHKGELDAFLKNNNVEKIYVSIDYGGAYGTWKETVEREKLEGLHYFASNETKFHFFSPNEGIPRYVFLDSDGRVLINQCERPSSGKLIPQIKDALGLE